MPGSLHFPTADVWLDRRWFYEERGAATRSQSKYGEFYQRLLQKYYSFLVPPRVRTLEIGCGAGDLLAAVRPSEAVGIDFSSKVISEARRRHSGFEFYVGDAATFKVDGWRAGGLCANAERIACLTEETFDYILMADLINDLPDVQAVFEHVGRYAHPGTRLVLNFFNNLWHPLIALGEWLGFKSRSLPQNWLSSDDVQNLLHLAGWEVVKREHRILWPFDTPIIGTLLNRFVGPLVSHGCLTVFMVARPASSGSSKSKVESSGWKSEVGGQRAEAGGERHYTCSVVIPARNEAGNIEEAIRRTPDMGLGTELIFVEGHSKDDTWQQIQRMSAKYPQREIKALKQKSIGKGGAVREGFAAATGDMLFILDADLTVPPEDLPKFYEIARSATADFVNGVRLVYPMQDEAMRFLNMLANKMFGLTFSWLLGQKIKDTLCGTKVLFRSDYEMIGRNRSYFGDFDPFGDFDLLFGAAKLNLRIIDLPIRYRARTYGQTNIQRWRHGWLLARMVVFAARLLKFY